MKHENHYGSSGCRIRKAQIAHYYMDVQVYMFAPMKGESNPKREAAS
jgi:hypothetical protein